MRMKTRLISLAALCLASGTAWAAPEKKPKAPAAESDFVEKGFPFYSSVLDARKLGEGFPSDNLTPRGLILNLGNNCWACFDTDLLRMAAIWTGSGVSPASMAQISYRVAGDKAPEGQDKLPLLVGNPLMANGIYPGWQAGTQAALTDPRSPGPNPREVGRGPIDPTSGQFRAVRLAGAGVMLEYTVGGASVRELVEARLVQGQPVVQRRFRIEGAAGPLWLLLGRKAPKLAVAVDNPAAAEISELAGGLAALRVRASAQPVEFTVAAGFGSGVSPGKEALAAPAARWPQTLATKGTLSAAKDAYVVDDIALPADNPWKRNVRLADLAFFPDGRAAAVTFDGDVWTVTGLEGNLTEVRWKRFASGLHEPLGIAVRGEELFVNDRNGVWRLRDTDRNGEADVHELFSNAFTQTAETREYASGLRLAPDGSFLIAKGGILASHQGAMNGTVLRVSPDGRTVTVLAHGLREPFLGVNPKTGLVTASDQQGNYVPSTPIHVIGGNQYYGFLPSKEPKEQYPEAIADPVVWIPHSINASGVTQAWLTDPRMGPLADSLVHIGYYRPELFLVLLNHRSPKLEGAVLSLTHDLEFAPLAGAMNPKDGQFYVTGFQIWGTTAKRLSGLARVRYTGAPSLFPREVAPMKEGVLLKFDTALDAKKAANPASFSAERWAYQRTAAYGSPHFKPDGTKGQENMVPSSAYLSKDGKSVFLGLPNMKPVMQMRVGWSLATATGGAFDQNAYLTSYDLPSFDPAKEGFAPVTVDLTPRQATAAAATPVTAEEGKRLSELMGCVACHSLDGTSIGKVGPSWKGLFGSTVEFADGGKGPANEAYLRQSIREPAAKIVKGYEKSDASMPSYDGVMTDSQIESVVLYLKSLK